MTRPSELTYGTHNNETPIVVPINKDGEPSEYVAQFDPQDIIEVKLQESISQYVVFGTVKFSDRGKLKMFCLMREGFDYLEMTLRSNREDGGEYRKVKFEIINIVGIEQGHIIGSAYDEFTVTIAQFPAYRNLLTWRVSKGYHDLKISEIVEDLFRTFLNKDPEIYKLGQLENGSTTVEITKGKLESFCIPFWSVYQTINYLKRYALAADGKTAGFHSWFDLSDQFHFQSLETIMDPSSGDTHEIDLKDIVNTSIKEAQKDTQKVINDYYPEFVHKEFYKIGLSGASAERFNWFKKKEYTLKNGYKVRPVRDVNKIFEEPDDINNMFGFHIPTGYRGESDKQTCQALVYNQLLTSIAAQVQTRIVIDGITNNGTMKAGDKITIKNKARGAKENVEELEGDWFVRTVNHTWNTKGVPYRQVIALSRIGNFKH